MINFDASRGAVLAVAGRRAPLSDAAYEAVSRVGASWHQNVEIPAAPAVPAAAVAAAAMSAARLATSGHVADVPQHKRTAKTFASVKRGTT